MKNITELRDLNAHKLKNVVVIKHTLLKQKHEKDQIQVQSRCSCFGIKNVLYLKKMFFFQEKIMICAW
jgi:hypothetical protein